MKQLVLYLTVLIILLWLSECYCGEGSTSCHFDHDGIKICNCSSLFAQRNGTCTETCFSDRHCKGRAVCRMGEGGAANFCECPPNYEGEDCEINSLCNRIKPSCYSRGATCEIIDSTAFCRCKPETAPDPVTGLCLYICTFDKCLHGKCEVVGLGYRCKCDDGYTGHRCETKIRSEFNLLQFVVLASTNAVIILLLLGILCLACRRRDKNFV
ncbi:hypothetical protein CDAR_525151 [Caerostris darwini]|uniref:EGF-like domain-containing protein n=1 Tax=Caerostris darwini TaxID=1538125 RepID=A0AAV4SGX8_9ARAC|nr:hypothetical protein CDAR_525151 [Caerostris darwini]